MKYRSFNDLPNHIRRRIQAVMPSAKVAEWVQEGIPALGNRSILDVMNEDGEEADERVLQFLMKIEGYFT